MWRSMLAMNRRPIRILLFIVVGVTQVAAALYQSQILREPAPAAR
jgi:hypothetical protein